MMKIFQIFFGVLWLLLTLHLARANDPLYVSSDDNPNLYVNNQVPYTVWPDGNNSFGDVGVGFGSPTYSQNSNTLTCDTGTKQGGDGANTHVGYYGQDNQIIVTNDIVHLPSYSSSGQAVYLGYYSNDTNNSINVLGGNNSIFFESDGPLYIGVEGANNSVYINDGGAGITKSNVYIGSNSTATNNKLSVQGDGSLFTNNQTIYVGSSAGAQGVLYIGNFAVLNANNIEAFTSGSSISANSAVITASSISLSTGTAMYISAGGQVNVSNITLDNAILSSAQGSLNFVNMQLIGSSSWNNSSNSVIIGSVSNNSSLLISNTANLTSLGGIIGNSKSSNSVIVTGSSCYWHNNSSLLIGASGNNNSMFLSDGANATTVGQLIVGNLGASNSLIINDSTWTSSTNLIIGNVGNVNEMILSNHATLYSGGSNTNPNVAVNVIGNAANNNTVIVTNSSTWNSSNTIIIGSGSSSNNMTISAGSIVRSLGGTIGSGSSSLGNSVLVSDSYWNVASNTITLAGNSSSLIITNLGVVICSNFTLSQPSNTSDTNNLLITGTGSLLGASGTLSVGSNCSVIATNGGVINALPLIINGGSVQIYYSGSLVDTPTQLNNGELYLFSNGTVPSFNWSNGLLRVSPGVTTLTVTGGMTNGGHGGTFDFTGCSFNNDTNVLINYGSQSNFHISDYKATNVTGITFITNATSVSEYIATNATMVVGIDNTLDNFFQVSAYYDTSNTTTIGAGGILNATDHIEISDGSTMINDGEMITSGDVLNNGTQYGTGDIFTHSYLLNGILVAGLGPPSIPTPGINTIFGNLVMGDNGTLVELAASPTLYRRLLITGTASLKGTFRFVFVNGYTPSYGQVFSNVIVADDGITGNFDNITTSDSTRRIRMILNTNQKSANALAAPASYAQAALNQNQTNVALALNSFIPATSGDEAVVSTALDYLTASQYPNAFNQISPALYTSLATLAFNSAVAQYNEMVQRLGNIRVAGVGFSTMGLENAAIIDDSKSSEKNSKDILIPSIDNHWGLFVDGNGIFANVNINNQLPGYNAESGGATIGVNYKWNDKFSSGFYTGYEGMQSKQSGGNFISDNGCRFGLFATYQEGGFFANTLIGGDSHSYQINRSIQFPGINRTASSAPTAGEFDSMLVSGYDIRRGNFTFGPITSLQYTYFGLQPFTESGAQSLDLTEANANANSMVYNLGAHSFFNWQATKNILVLPQINLAWQHEFLQNPYALNSSFGNGTSFAYMSTTPNRDSLYTGVGFTVNLNKKYDASFFYNASACNPDVVSQNFFVSLGMTF